jgi:hypothetical protein
MFKGIKKVHLFQLNKSFAILSSLLELVLLSSLLFTSVTADCPNVANTDITPCLCLNNQIRCEGKSVTDAILKTVFEKIDKSRPNYMKTFEGLELYDTNVTKIAPQVIF